MSMNAADHIYTLRRTPFALAPVIHSFYDHWDPTEKDILLSYLVLPLIGYKPMQKFLHHAGKSSSLRTLMQEPKRVLGLEARIEEYKPITNAALLILNSEKSIKINEDMSLAPLGKVREENAEKQLMKYARKLAVVFSGENVVSVYRSLGLKSL
ncbi:three component ABC system middle component [Pseudomonas putida]|uniref:three component ABC system middle component n=1 Tax=Pseudomonas putida TaxID=303 RepID=UPI002117BD6A|nr:three component ABC system middle component [Pseudomonas putida]